MLPVQTYPLTLTAGQTTRLLVQGEYFKIVAATGPVNVVSTFGRLNGISIGQGLEKTPFQYLEITDASGLPNAVNVLVGDENFIDALNGSVTVVAGKQPQSSVFAHVQKTVTQVTSVLAAANALRQYFLVQNRDTVGNIYVVIGAAATVALGVKVAPGETFELTATLSTQAINVIGDIASNANVVVVEG